MRRIVNHNLTKNSLYNHMQKIKNSLLKYKNQKLQCIKKRNHINIAFVYNASFLESLNLNDKTIKGFIDQKLTTANEVMKNHGLHYTFKIGVIKKTLLFDNFTFTYKKNIEVDFLNADSEIRKLYRRTIRENQSSVFYFMTGSSSEGPVPGSTVSESNSMAFINGSCDSRYNLICDYATIDSITPIKSTSLIHEFGHLLGCGHDWPYSKVFTKLYNNAHKRTSVSVDKEIDDSIGTIMSYSERRVNFFSTPHLNYPGTNIPMGDEHANNLKFITEKIVGPYENRLHKFCNIPDLFDSPELDLDLNIHGKLSENYLEPLFVTLHKGTTYIFPKIVSPLNLEVKVEKSGDELDIFKPGTYAILLKAVDSAGRENFFTLNVLVLDN